MLKNKITASVVAGGMALVGLVSGIAAMASAQSVTTVNPANDTRVVSPTTGTAEVANTNEVSSKPDTDQIDNQQGDQSGTADSIDQQGEHVDGASDKNGIEVKDINETASSLDKAGE